jgi:hypothetical protein
LPRIWKRRREILHDALDDAIDDKLVRGSSSVRRWGLRPCPICRHRPKPVLPTSRRRAGTACSRRGARRLIVAKLNAAARAAVEAVKKRFHDLSTVTPDANEHASEVLGQLMKRDVEKYRKLLEEKK